MEKKYFLLVDYISLSCFVSSLTWNFEYKNETSKDVCVGFDFSFLSCRRWLQNAVELEKKNTEYDCWGYENVWLMYRLISSLWRILMMLMINGALSNFLRVNLGKWNTALTWEPFWFKSMPMLLIIFCFFGDEWKFIWFDL